MHLSLWINIQHHFINTQLELSVLPVSKRFLQSAENEGERGSSLFPWGILVCTELAAIISLTFQKCKRVTKLPPIWIPALGGPDIRRSKQLHGTVTTVVAHLRTKKCGLRTLQTAYCVQGPICSDVYSVNDQTSFYLSPSDVIANYRQGHFCSKYSCMEWTLTKLWCTGLRLGVYAPVPSSLIPKSLVIHSTSAPSEHYANMYV